MGLQPQRMSSPMSKEDGSGLDLAAVTEEDERFALGIEDFACFGPRR